MADHTIYVLPYATLLESGTIIEVQAGEEGDWAALLEDACAQKPKNFNKAKETQAEIREGTFVFPCYKP